MESISESPRERLYRADAFDKVARPLPFSIVLKFLLTVLSGSIVCMLINAEMEFFFLCTVVILFIIFLIFYSKAGIRKLNKIKKEFYKLPEEEKKRYDVTEVSVGNILIEWPMLKNVYDDAFAVMQIEVEKARNAPCNKCFFKFDHGTREEDMRELTRVLNVGDYAKQSMTGCVLGIVPYVVGEGFFCSDVVKRDESVKKFKEKFNTEDLLDSLNDLKDEIISIVDKNEKEKGDNTNGLE